eukprot:TRINITY_DN16756_c0_g1_i12.p11 TRINITY_DN16756_c0_g1~~TRINITY_DN16756_c0_g1_i12.p11  ORF type:complete len:110 (+),score=4.38 TRINITY_DN16756_c0_g1_i12:953-1282(+)
MLEDFGNISLLQFRTWESTSNIPNKFTCAKQHQFCTQKTCAKQHQFCAYSQQTCTKLVKYTLLVYGDPYEKQILLLKLQPKYGNMTKIMEHQTLSKNNTKKLFIKSTKY